jgi:hypothetical protein
MNELNAYLIKIAKVVMNEVGKKATKHLQDNIQKYIYDYGDLHRETYSPTHEFLNTPEHTSPKVDGNEVSTEVFHNTDNLSVDVDNFQHGSNYQTSDIRQWLPKVLNDNLSGNIWGDNRWYQNREHYFDITVNELIDSGLALKWIKDEYKKLGFDIG